MWGDLMRKAGPSRPWPLAAVSCIDGGTVLLSVRCRSLTSIPINPPFIHRTRTAPAAAGSTGSPRSTATRTRIMRRRSGAGFTNRRTAAGLGRGLMAICRSRHGMSRSCRSDPNRHRDLVLRRPGRQPGRDQREQRWGRDLDKAGHQHSTRRLLYARTPRRAVCVRHQHRPTQSRPRVCGNELRIGDQQRRRCDLDLRRPDPE